jgi:hypothetical protein
MFSKCTRTLTFENWAYSLSCRWHGHKLAHELAGCAGKSGATTLLWLIVLVEGLYFLKSSLYTISSGYGKCTGTMTFENLRSAHMRWAQAASKAQAASEAQAASDCLLA